MPQFGPVKRRQLIACLRQLGFSGPYAAGKRVWMASSATPSWCAWVVVSTFPMTRFECVMYVMGWLGSLK